MAAEPEGRVLGLDLGSRRIGVAVSDAGRRLATPLTVIERSGDRSTDHHRIAALAAEEEAVVVVVGLPRSLDGADGPAAAAARAEATELAAVLRDRGGGIPVELADERLTTVEAHRRLAESGMGGRRRRKVVDRAAAALLLQAWLDRRRP
ncbi:MAG: Holliday junction resolvase RuvX [Actinobacteria bacterium]|nr:Holliday junction resolvase RuvX [Actinomycetota bacterium]